MTLSLPVTAHSLRRRRVRLRDTVLEQANLFPLFDRQGRVRALMLVWPPRGRIVILELKPELVVVPWWGEIEIRSAFAALRDVDAGLAAAYADLWHYDPWWVLRAAPFEGHSAVPVLKATNCAGGFLKPVYGCYFIRDLSRLSGVATKSKMTSGLAAFDRTFVRFTPELLPERPEATRPVPPKKQWRLNSFWLRNGWPLPPSPAGVAPSR